MQLEDTFEPRSEDPNVELGGNLTTNEYQGENGYISQKLGIGDCKLIKPTLWK